MVQPYYISGERAKLRPKGTVLEVRSPWDARLIGEAALADAHAADDAVSRCVLGRPKARALAAYERAGVLEAIAAGIREEREGFAQLITAETGKPIRFSRIETDRAVFTFETAAEEAKRIGGEVLPLDLAEASVGRMGIIRRFPIGIVLCIAPFNYPLNLVAHKVAPAIAAGNAFILKPAPQAPLTALKLAELIAATPYPREAWSVIPCENDVAEGLVSDDRIAMLSFTGSSKVGWHLKYIAGRKKVLLELGGNAGVIVDETADLDQAVQKNVLGSFGSSGQVCIKVQRIFVHRRRFEEYVGKFVSAARSLKCGDPSDPDTVVGPLIDDAAAARIEGWIAAAVASGGRALLSGSREGRVLTPTILTNVPRTCDIVAEEAFGPVATVHPFGTIDEAIAGINDSRYGLQAGIFTNDLQRALTAFSAIDTGAVVVNDNPTYRIDHMPYGGIKHSGFGREGVKYAIEAMTEPKLLVM